MRLAADGAVFVERLHDQKPIAFQAGRLHGGDAGADDATEVHRRDCKGGRAATQPTGPEGCYGRPMSKLREHASSLHRRCQALITRYLQRYWYRAAQGASGLGDLFVTLEEVRAELEVGELQPPVDFESPDAVEGRLRKFRAEERALRVADPTLPSARLAVEAGLEADALEALLIANTLQVSPGLLRTCTFAWADFSVKQPTAAFLVELLSDDAEHRARLEAALAPDAPLRRLRLLLLGEDRRWQPATPLLQRPVAIPDAVSRYLAHQPVQDEIYPPGAVRLEWEGPGPDVLVLSDRTRPAQVLGRLARREDTMPVVLAGAVGSGRRTLVRAYALAARRPLQVVDLQALAWELEPFEAQLASTLRDGLLNGAVVLLRAESLEEKTDRRIGVLGRTLRALGLPVAVSCTDAQLALFGAALPEIHLLNVGDVGLEDRPSLYVKLMRHRGFDAPPVLVNQLSDGYRLRPGDMDKALRDVRGTSESATALDVPAFDQAVRRQVRTSLSALASPVNTTQRWKDLVLPLEQKEAIEEIVMHARYRTRVFEEWGFAQKIGSRGRGLGCLFSGPPGTGKTMTATLIAQELGLDLYQVDLSRIVDKYVGETEKNLARLFDEASRVPVVLLFDEADSLFATRTKVESSNDRYANLEVNFLLQRMETHDGISILTTNLGTGIDQAFKRRLRFRIHFELPEAEEREVLWRSMVPPGLEVAPDVDWGALARRWELSGALIRNAMLRAAFLAAATQSILSNELLLRATRAELIEMGRLGS